MRLARRLLVLSAVVLACAAAAEPQASPRTIQLNDAGSGLRLLNTSGANAEALLRCGGAVRVIRVEGRSVVDVAPSEVCDNAVLEHAAEIVAFETRSTGGTELQRELRPEAACETLPLSMPQFACVRGTATASVRPVAGATYVWSVEGATISGGHGTNAISLSLADAGTVRVTALVTGASCTTTAAGAIAVREPLVISGLGAWPPESVAGQAVTVRWSYSGSAEPRTQVLRGSAFDAPVTLTAAERSYTFTPTTGGAKSIELLASYAPSPGATSPAAGARRRAVGSTVTWATDCPSATAAAQLRVDGCALAPRPISAPEEGIGGEYFLVSVEAEPGESVDWTATNSTLTQITGPSIRVLPDADATSVDVTAVVTRTATCSASSSLTVPVRPRVDCSTRKPPTATIELAGIGCRRATAVATFTGTPPFVGAWSDGTYFSTSNTTLTHHFTAPGAYTMHTFGDASCRGEITSTASATRLAPSVTLSTAGGTCTNSRLVATFSGTPPFTGRWSDGQAFTTSDYTLERSNMAERAWWVTDLYDGLCTAGQPAESNKVHIITPPLVVHDGASFCATGGDGRAQILSWLVNGVPPFTVYWSDGEVTTSETIWMTRTAPVAGWESELSIVRATTAECEAAVRNPSVVLYNRPAPEIGEPTRLDICEGETRTVWVTNTLHPSAQLIWSLTNAELVTGQGKREMVLKSAPTGDVGVRVDAVYPNGACASSDSVTLVRSVAASITDLRVEPATITAGGKAEVIFTLQGSWYALGAYTVDFTRSGDLRSAERKCDGPICRIPYVDTRGPGDVAIRVGFNGRCEGNGGTSSVTLKIVP